MKKIWLFSVFVLLLNFDGDKKAKKIVDKVIETHGGKKYEEFTVEFDFRQFHYIITNNKGNFSYTRTFEDKDKNKITDVLTNNSFVRTKNNQVEKLTEKEVTKLSNQVNSVAYFMLLPYKLNDAAVNLEFVGTTTINKQEYNKVKVWFNKAGGGTDFNDVYCYWFNTKTNTLDYLAYKNGGPRFRKAKNSKVYNGIIFQDYDNYQTKDTLLSVVDYDKEFVNQKMTLLSTIEQTNLVVK